MDGLGDGVGGRSRAGRDEQAVAGSLPAGGNSSGMLQGPELHVQKEGGTVPMVGGGAGLSCLQQSAAAAPDVELSCQMLIRRSSTYSSR
jgi:hypothetical protein